MGKYHINFRRFVAFLLPIILRTESIIEYIFTLLEPIRRLHFQFSTHIDDTNISLSYNSQYPNLQRLLNDRFDFADRRIEVRDSGDSIPDLVVRPNEELKPLVLGQLIIRPSYMWGYRPFTVIVPAVILTNIENQIRRILDEYKFAGSKYIIIVK